MQLQESVFRDIIVEKATEYNDLYYHQEPPIALIKSDIRVVFGSVFCDFGAELNVLDVNAEEAHMGIVASVTNKNPALVDDDERPDLRMGILLLH